MTPSSPPPTASEVADDDRHRPTDRRRSVLYMPGANDKALEKAKALPTDAIIFDTEDSVAPDMKADGPRQGRGRGRRRGSTATAS